jgi:hypothetical protein
MHTRKNAHFTYVFLLATAVTFSSAIAGAQQKPEELAQQSAGDWLALVDSGKYSDSWQEAASLFKAAVAKDQWQNMLHASRAPLGKLASRKLKNATYTKTLPGAPDGEYVVIQYDASFEHKQSAVEPSLRCSTKMASGECRGITSNRAGRAWENCATVLNVCCNTKVGLVQV